MSIVTILDYPDQRLNQPGDVIEDINDKAVQQMIDDMIETLYNTKNCAGLASTQLDFKHPKQISVIDLSEAKNDLVILINPEIIHAEGETFTPEGCMSVYPDHIHNPVRRAERVKVKTLTRDGGEKVIETGGFFAKCLQHEIDHLNGILYIDRIAKVKRKMVDKKIQKLIKKLRNSSENR